MRQLSAKPTLNLASMWSKKISSSFLLLFLLHLILVGVVCVKGDDQKVHTLIPCLKFNFMLH